MRLRLLSLPLMSLALAGLGCTATEGPTAKVPEPTPAQQVIDLTRNAKEAEQDLQDYTFQQKAEFIARTQTQLDELSRDLEQLATKTETGSDAVKAEYRPKIVELRDQLAKLHTQLDTVRSTDASTWNDVKNGTRKGYRELKERVQGARQWLSEKIAP